MPMSMTMSERANMNLRTNMPATAPTSRERSFTHDQAGQKQREHRPEPAESADTSWSPLRVQPYAYARVIRAHGAE